jgi:hypothetical protein
VDSGIGRCCDRNDRSHLLVAMMAKRSKATAVKAPEVQVTPEENSVCILPPRTKRPAALFWDVYRNTEPDIDIKPVQVTTPVEVPPAEKPASPDE